MREAILGFIIGFSLLGLGWLIAVVTLAGPSCEKVHNVHQCEMVSVPVEVMK